jgi:hypothetical protein
LVAESVSRKSGIEVDEDTLCLLHHLVHRECLPEELYRSFKWLRYTEQSHWRLLENPNIDAMLALFSRPMAARPMTGDGFLDHPERCTTNEISGLSNAPSQGPLNRADQLCTPWRRNCLIEEPIKLPRRVGSAGGTDGSPPGREQV